MKRFSITRLFVSSLLFALVNVDVSASDTVLAPPTKLNASLMWVNLAGDANRIYEFQASSNLLNWTTVAKAHSGDGRPSYLQAGFGAHAQRYYRSAQYPAFTGGNTTYHGWSDAVVMGNGAVEVIVVPSIGRVLQFRRAGQAEGPFWSDRSLDGVNPSQNGYQNFGGDKAWPAPQSVWNWPPPTGFDEVSYTLSDDRVTMKLNGPLHAESGIQVERLIVLDHFLPVLTITTKFTRVQAPANAGYQEVSIWVVTQLQNPVKIFLPTSTSPAFPNGYVPLGGFNAPPDLAIANGLIAFTRDPGSSRKIGNDSDRLLWVGPDDVLLMSSPRKAGATYPDNGCSAEVYTNSGSQNPYIELELLTQLEALPAGNFFEQIVTYQLLPRTESTPEAEAAKLLPP